TPRGGLGRRGRRAGARGGGRGARVVVGAETVRRFIVRHEDRLDRAIVEAMPELSRSQVRRLIEGGDVHVDGRVVEKAATVVRAGASVEVVPPVVPDLDLVAGDVPLDILYEDEET